LSENLKYPGGLGRNFSNLPPRPSPVAVARRRGSLPCGAGGRRRRLGPRRCRRRPSRGKRAYPLDGSPLFRQIAAPGALARRRHQAL